MKPQPKRMAGTPTGVSKLLPVDAVANDAVIPAQMVRCRQPTPEVRLWIAALEDAIGWAVFGTGFAPRGGRVGHIRDARRWIESDAMFVGSFAWVCDALHLDRQGVRRRVMAGQYTDHRSRKRIAAA